MSLQCVFCNSDGPFTIEHIIPESLGNDDLLLKEQVCGKCNDYFSRKIEAVVLSKSPIAFWRVFLEIRTKKKLLPSVELSQPQQESGILPSVHRSHDDGISFTAHEDGPIRLTVADQGMYEEIMRGERNTLQFVFTPKLLMAMGRFLCKIGIELVCLNDAVRARSSGLEKARKFARFGESQNLWPIFYFAKGSIDDLRRVRSDEKGLVEDVDCYSYALLEVGVSYLLLRFSMGTDNWVVCLNDPYPTPEINRAFPGEKLKLIWYSPEEISK